MDTFGGQCIDRSCAVLVHPAALWVVPVSFAIAYFSSGVQDKFYAKSSAAKLVLADGIQEFIETVRDLKSNNAEDKYLVGLDRKIDEVEKRSILTELGVAVFIVSAGLVLKLGIATVALVGSVLLADDSLDLITFFAFLLLASRLCAYIRDSFGFFMKLSHGNQFLNFM